MYYSRLGFLVTSKQMTLSDLEWLFWVKICLRFGIYWLDILRLSDKIVRKLAELRIYFQRQNIAQGT